MNICPTFHDCGRLRIHGDPSLTLVSGGTNRIPLPVYEVTNLPSDWLTTIIFNLIGFPNKTTEFISKMLFHQTTKLPLFC